MTRVWSSNGLLCYDKCPNANRSNDNSTKNLATHIHTYLHIKNLAAKTSILAFLYNSLPTCLCTEVYWQNSCYTSARQVKQRCMCWKNYYIFLRKIVTIVYYARLPKNLRILQAFSNNLHCVMLTFFICNFFGCPGNFSGSKPKSPL